MPGVCHILYHHPATRRPPRLPTTASYRPMSLRILQYSSSPPSVSHMWLTGSNMAEVCMRRMPPRSNTVTTAVNMDTVMFNFSILIPRKPVKPGEFKTSIPFSFICQIPYLFGSSRQSAYYTRFNKHKKPNKCLCVRYRIVVLFAGIDKLSFISGDSNTKQMDAYVRAVLFFLGRLPLFVAGAAVVILFVQSESSATILS